MKDIFFRFSFLVALLVPSIGFADVDWRGFQIPPSEITEHVADLIGQEPDDVSNHWHTNVVRFHVGNDSLQDDIENAADYEAMMNPPLVEFEEALELLCSREGAKTRAILSIYSAPGGFASRVPGSVNEELFVSPWAQETFVNYWGFLAERFLNHEHRDCLFAFDLKNEPIQHYDDDELPAGVVSWNELALRALQAIRRVDEEVTVIVPAEGANAAHLKDLPDEIGNDANVLYSFHGYPTNEYQHVGVNDGPFKPLPSKARIKNRLLKPVADHFLAQQKKLNADRRSISFLPTYFITEWAVSRFAPSPDVFMSRFLELVEGDAALASLGQNRKRGKKKKMKKRIRKKCSQFKGANKKAFKQCARKQRKKVRQAEQRNEVIRSGELEIKGWTAHSLKEFHGWSPEYGNGADDEAQELPYLSDRGAVLHEFFQRNLAESVE